MSAENSCSASHITEISDTEQIYTTSDSRNIQACSNNKYTKRILKDKRQLKK